MVLEDGLDYAGLGGLMSTAMKYRGLTGAIVDGGIRDTPQITKLQFPVFSRGVVPSTTVNHFPVCREEHPCELWGITVKADDIVVADMDGVAVVPREHAEEVLKKRSSSMKASTACSRLSKNTSRFAKRWPSSADCSPSLAKISVPKCSGT